MTLPPLDLNAHHGLRGWHAGVTKAQRQMGFEAAVREGWEHHDETMPAQHRIFHTHNLHFIPLCILDEERRPWVSILAPLDGNPEGWVSSPSERELLIQSDVAEGDPLLDHVYDAEPFLVASVGVELSTRRRNKWAGEATAILKGRSVTIHIRTDEVSVSHLMPSAIFDITYSIGNCPKYFNTRQFTVTTPHPRIAYSSEHLAAGDKLPSEVIDSIRGTSISFLGTYYEPEVSEAAWHSPHLGCNHRGGSVGFLRVRSDQRTVVLPDHSGNRMLTSLGNIESTPVAALTIPNFRDGSVLYLTGEATNLYGADAKAVMPRVNALTLIRVTGYRYVLDAMPIRSPEVLEFSPYNPKVHYLAEEQADSSIAVSDTSLLLTSIVLHASDLATFVWQTSKPVQVVAGQYAIIDTTPLFGQQYQHMAMRGYEKGVNDDGIRSWTISRSSSDSISLTVREMPFGKVTGTLLALARGLSEKHPDRLADCSQLGVRFDLIGIGGAFSLTEEVLLDPKPLRLLYVAAGIGVTPLLAIVSSLTRDADIQLVWSVRDPVDVALELLATALKGKQVTMQISLFVTKGDGVSHRQDWPFEVKIAKTRATWTTLDIPDRHIFLCGTPAFEKAAMEGLVAAGADPQAIKRESFNF